MQQADVLRSDDVYQSRRLQMPYLDKARLEREQVRMRQCKVVGPPFPVDDPVRPRPPPVAIDEEGEVGIMQQELAIQPFNGHWNVILSGHKIQRSVGIIQKRLRLKSLQADNLESSSASNA